MLGEEMIENCDTINEFSSLSLLLFFVLVDEISIKEDKYGSPETSTLIFMHLSFNFFG